ncbi:uncharacterized protein [Rutidosis leptorrhynchoides]|uniref:uncharacterized protein n=1 Tax=Rutidosis leptorrhynchoides TaxID=125765 RepID=UPI003A99F3F9
MASLDYVAIKAFWGNFHFKVAASSARGRSGGIVTIWDPRVFTSTRVISFDNVLVVQGHFANRSSVSYIFNVYAPQSLVLKKRLWLFIISFMASNEGGYLIFGDFNYVRTTSERMGTGFCNRTSEAFNNFIEEGNLVDIPLGGRAYTRANKSFTKRAKLDRFLASNGFLNSFPNLVGSILTNLWSDHCPILFAMSCWNNTETYLSSNPQIRFKDKLKRVKGALKEWNISLRSQAMSDRISLVNQIKGIDDELQLVTDPISLASSRSEILKDLTLIESAEASNMAQKNRKLAISLGDENTSFFTLQSIENEKCFKLTRSKKQCGRVVVTKPRGPTVSLLDSLNTFGKRLNMISSVCPKQTAFIKGHQILDCPLIINELVEWCKKRKKKALFFKVDFDKAFDSIHWEYILTMLSNVGFGPKWVSWIRACLSSSCASVLINGSPSAEFTIGRGLRQGDPLSPLLFIIGMEGLTAALKDALDASLYKGLRVGDPNHGELVSHCIYADDALFVGEWDDTNATNLVTILGCFFLVSGLKVDLLKSNLFGVGVHSQEVARLAAIMGCSNSALPFHFLGLPVGLNMSRIANWDPIISKIKKRLASWKTNMISFGGSLTLIKSVLGGLGTYYISLFKAPCKVIHTMESLRAVFFFGRLLVNYNALWARVITLIHEIKSSDMSYSKRFSSGTWAAICKCVAAIHDKNMIPPSLMHIKLGNGSLSSFCLLAPIILSREKDIWVWDGSSSNIFSVSDARCQIDSHNLAPPSRKTDWFTTFPPKINIFIWHLKMQRLATKENLEKKGNILSNSACALCDLHADTDHHIFVTCNISRQIWVYIGSWVNMHIPCWASMEELWTWFDGLQIQGKKRLVLRSIWYSTLWNMWRLRNSYTFNDAAFRKSHVLDNIIVSSFFGCSLDIKNIKLIGPCGCKTLWTLCNFLFSFPGALLVGNKFLLLF